MSLQLSGSGVVTGLDSLASSDLGAQLGSKLDLAGGKILQIVRATDATLRTTTSTTFVDVTGMSVTITPQKSDSAILLVAVFRAGAFSTSNQLIEGDFQITDNSNNALSGAEELRLGVRRLGVDVSTSGLFAGQVLFARSTPAVITAVTYKLRFRSSAASVEMQVQNNSTTGQLFAIEVSA